MTGKEGGEIIVAPHLVPITISCVECVYLGALNALRVCVCVTVGSIMHHRVLFPAWNSSFVPSLRYSGGFLQIPKSSSEQSTF